MNNPSNFQISRAKDLCGKLLPFAGLALREGYLDLGVQKNPVAGTGSRRPSVSFAGGLSIKPCMYTPRACISPAGTSPTKKVVCSRF